MDAPVAAARPSRIPLWALATGLSLLALSFVSGLVIWGAQVVNARFDGVDNTWRIEARPWVLLHGALNPFLCGFLGYLTSIHIRLGWKMRANRWSGAGMVGTFAGLVLSGMALAYVGAEWLREALVWTHRLLGLALPVVLAVHWIGARRWLRKL